MGELEQIEAITQARYQQQQQSFLRLVAEENRLRGELLRLDERLRNTRNQSQEDTPLRAIGADIIWQGWVGRRKSELNMKLAQILALKEHHLVQVRAAYGKVLVVQELMENARRDKKQKTARTDLSRAVDQSLFS